MFWVLEDLIEIAGISAFVCFVVMLAMAF